jgi:hypothetical protein
MTKHIIDITLQHYLQVNRYAMLVQMRKIQQGDYNARNYEYKRLKDIYKLMRVDTHTRVSQYFHSIRFRGRMRQG